MTDLHAIASALPNVDVGIACAGTALESRTYRVGTKSFLFVSKKDARLKLAASADEARALGCAVGANGWVTLVLAALPAAAVVKRWVAESHALMAGGSTARTPAAPSTKKRATKKTSAGPAARKKATKSATKKSAK
jgi:hypothetical protein